MRDAKCLSKSTCAALGTRSWALVRAFLGAGSPRTRYIPLEKGDFLSLLRISRP